MVSLSVFKIEGGVLLIPLSVFLALGLLGAYTLYYQAHRSIYRTYYASEVFLKDIEKLLDNGMLDRAIKNCDLVKHIPMVLHTGNMLRAATKEPERLEELAESGREAILAIRERAGQFAPFRTLMHAIAYALLAVLLWANGFVSVGMLVCLSLTFVYVTGSILVTMMQRSRFRKHLKQNADDLMRVPNLIRFVGGTEKPRTWSVSVRIG